MGLSLVFLALPLVIYVSLCLLPRGRPAGRGISVAALVTFALWMLSDPFGEAGFGHILAAIAGAGIALAALVQGIRAVLIPEGDSWRYPALAVLAPLVALAVFLKLLGV